MSIHSEMLVSQPYGSVRLYIQVYKFFKIVLHVLYWGGIDMGMLKGVVELYNNEIDFCIQTYLVDYHFWLF